MKWEIYSNYRLNYVIEADTPEEAVELLALRICVNEPQAWRYETKPWHMFVKEFGTSLWQRVDEREVAKRIVSQPWWTDWPGPKQTG